jgi:hypothetical protein
LGQWGLRRTPYSKSMQKIDQFKRNGAKLFFLSLQTVKQKSDLAD